MTISKNRKRIVAAIIALGVIVTSVYGVTAAFSAGLFDTHSNNPNVIFSAGEVIHFSESGAATAYNNTVGTIWFGQSINPQSTVTLTGAWASNLGLKVIIIHESMLKNSTYIYSLLNQTQFALSGNINTTLAPISGGYEISFVPGPNETGEVTITQQIVAHPNT